MTPERRGRPGPRVLIVDDHLLFAEVIRTALEAEELDVIATAHTARRGFELACAERPDVVLVDMGLPDASGLALGAQILEEVPGSNVVALTAWRDERMAR